MWLLLLALVLLGLYALWLITHTLNLTWGGGSGLLGTTVLVSSNIEQNISQAFAPNTQNQLMTFAYAAGKLQSVFINVSQPATLYVNAASTGSPTDTVALTPGSPFVWYLNSGQRIPFVGTAGAVTALYITTPSGNTGNCQFDLRSLVSF